MKFDKNLSAIHGYLCGDGYVIKNPSHQKHKYYHIGFRNTNKILLRDFKDKFTKFFKIKPRLRLNERCIAQNKEVYYILTKNYSYYSYKWSLPKLSKENLRYWIRAFFDCEGWVENKPRQSRLIGLECCNEKGLLSVQQSLMKFDIESQIKKRKNRTIWALSIFSLKNLKRFQKEINFLHPRKRQKLQEAISSYVNYYWMIPEQRKALFAFIKKKGKMSHTRKEIRFHTIKKRNLTNLRKALNKYEIKSRIWGPWVNNTGSKNYYLTIKQKELVHERAKTRASFMHQEN